MVKATDGRDEHGRFRPGRSGNPGGRPRPIVRDLLRTALEEYEADGSGSKRTRAERLVERVLAIALDPNGKPLDVLKSIAWITEQVDGRLPQSITSDGESGGIVIRFADAQKPPGEPAE